MAQVLEVDLPRYESGDAGERRAVTDGVMRSLETGFVYARHGLPADLLDCAYEMLAQFFHMPREVKGRYVVPDSMGQTGYTGTLVETAAKSALPDWKEMLNWGVELPDGHPLRRRFPHRYKERRLPEDEVPGIGEALGTLHSRLLDLQRRFLRVVANGLGCGSGYFDGMLRNGPTLSRAIRYPPMTDAPSRGHVWADEHRDINLTTALPRATARGLQIKTADGWVDAVAPEGFAILNTGMMLERVTNGRIHAGVHRVVGEAGSSGERLSVVQFCHPTPWTVLAPIPTCIGPDRPPRHAPLTAGDWLDQVLYDINMVETARAPSSSPGYS